MTRPSRRWLPLAAAVAALATGATAAARGGGQGPVPARSEATAIALPTPGAAEVQLEVDLDLAGAIALALERNLELSLAGLGPVDARFAVDGAAVGFTVRVIPEIAADRGGDFGSTRFGVAATRRFVYGTELLARAAYFEPTGALPAQETWTVEVSQPLFRRFGRLVNEEPLVAASAALAAAERRLAEQRADLVLEVVTAYEQLLRLQRQVAADATAQQRSELLSRLTAAQERLGRATRVDALRASLQVGQLQARLEGSRERLALAHQDLAVLVGAAPGSRYKLAPPPRLELELPPLADAVAVALGRRLDYAQALADAADGRRQTRLAQRQRLPDLAATARYDHLDGGLLPGLDADVLRVGVRVSGDWLLPEARLGISRAELAENAGAQRVRIVEQLVTRDVQRAWLALRRSRADIPLLERNLDHARSRQEIASRLFRAGRGDSFTVVDAEAALVAAESEYLDGLAAEALDGYRLLHEMGVLVEVPEPLRPAPGVAERRP